MSLGRTRADSLDLAALIDGIHHGHVVLPDFQRDFIWTERDVIALLATVLAGWPIGSLLLMTGPPSFFKVRAFENSPSSGSEEPEFIVLDGQQRLTSLYHALWGRGRNVYALELAELHDDRSVDALEDALSYFRTTDWERRYPKPKSQLAAGLLPVFALRSPADFFAWRDDATSGLPADERERATGELSELYRTLLAGMDRYTVPSIVVARSIPAEAIARIFERVNKTGLKLSAFDLMVARSYAPDFNLRDEWERARLSDYPRVGAWLGDNGLPVLHLIALRNQDDLRESGVLRLRGTEVRDGWGRALDTLSEAIGFLVHECGVLRPDWLPYRNVMLVLAAFAYDRDLREAAEALRLWFWRTCFSGSYDVASNTRAVKDLRLLTDEPATFQRGLRLVREDVLESTPRQKASLHRAFLSALAANGAVDILSGAPLTVDSLEIGRVPEIEYVSLFSKNEQEGAAADPPAYRRTLSSVLVASPPSSLLREGAESLVEERSPDILASQMLPANLHETPWEEVLTFRLEAVRRFLLENGLRVEIVERDEFESV